MNQNQFEYEPTPRSVPKDYVDALDVVEWYMEEGYTPEDAMREVGLQFGYTPEQSAIVAEDAQRIIEEGLNPKTKE